MSDGLMNHFKKQARKLAIEAKNVRHPELGGMTCDEFDEANGGGESGEKMHHIDCRDFGIIDDCPVCDPESEGGK
jgi:hypothetical protein